MAGTAKPNINNLGSEVIPTIIYSQDYLLTGAKGLFDGVQTNQLQYNELVCFWHDSSIYIDLLIPQNCNIWRSGVNNYKGYNYPLKILKYNGSSYDDVTALYPQILNAIGNTEWEKTISNLSAGQYRFQYDNGYRVDCEWYLEKVTIIKCLIKQNNQYYSIKDNTITQLGAPTDDTQKEQWFDDYGVEDLKDALLTPDTNGNKLIDSLDNQFEVRMMKAK